MNIGERIKSIRLEKGLTQKEVAARCGMADSAIRKYESGKVTPKVEMLERISSALEVPVASLMGWDAPDAEISFEVPISELQESVHYMLGGSIQEQKKPTPVSEDGLDELDKQLIGLMKSLTVDQKELLLAQLLTLTGRGK